MELINLIGQTDIEKIWEGYKQAEPERLRKEVEDLQKKLEEEKAYSQRLKKDYDGVVEEKKRADGMNGGLGQKISKIEEENEGLRREISRAGNDYVALQNDYHGLETENQRLENIMGEFREMLEDITRKKRR